MEARPVILVGGGSRSGKTRFALSRARSFGSRLAYIATAELNDPEMQARAEAHRAERGTDFETWEVPHDLAAAVERMGKEYDAVVVDCLTLWTSNRLLAGFNPAAEARAVADVSAAARAAVILVTNEVGCGIVPENELSRRFRDHAGWVNQVVAERAAEVWWLIFGCPWKVKGGEV